MNSQSQETNTYGFGWSQFNQSYTAPNGYGPIYDAFQYKDSKTLQGSSVQGRYGTYDVSGYVYEMRGKLSFLQGNLTLLKQMDWLDRQTRAIIVEFSAYNPNIELIMVATILIEFLPSGTILTMARFDPLNLFGESSGVSLKTICEFVFLAFIVYFIVTQIIECVKIGMIEYVKDFWSLVEWSIILTAFISFIMFLLRYLAAQEVLRFFQTTGGYGYINLQKANVYNQTLTYSLGLCSSLGTIKFLKMLRFNSHISILGVTLRVKLNFFFILVISFSKLKFIKIL